MPARHKTEDMYQPENPIPVSIITGFLGAGKSTLLNRLLKDPALSDAAVIINEFGEIGIDHLLVETSGDSIIELSNGCLCCTVRGELIDTFANLLDAMQTERVKPVSRVIIETTGLADPVPVLKAVMAHPALAEVFAIDGVVTVIDAVNGLKTLKAHSEAVRQAAVADRLVLTKTDLADARTTQDLAERLRALNPMAGQFDAAAEGQAVPALLSAGGFDIARKSDTVGVWLSEEDGDEHHHHHHHHDVNRHGDNIRAFALTTGEVRNVGVIQRFLERLAATHGDNILRVKGLVYVTGKAAPVAVHGVQATVHPPRELPTAPPDARMTRLVVITQDLAEEPVRELFNTFLDRPGIDRPDRAAIEENPLSAFGFKL